jgi:hypothetical protein
VIAGSEDGALYLWDLGTEPSSSLSPTSVSTLSPRTAAVQTPTTPKILHPAKPTASQRRALPSQSLQEAAAVIACAWSPAGMPVVSSDRMGGVTFWGAEEETDKSFY